MRASIEFAHAEIKDLKDESQTRKENDVLTRQRLEKLEKENEVLNKSVIDLKASQCAITSSFIICQRTRRKIQRKLYTTNTRFWKKS
jgi:hypothetical protein